MLRYKLSSCEQTLAQSSSRNPRRSSRRRQLVRDAGNDGRCRRHREAPTRYRRTATIQRVGPGAWLCWPRALLAAWRLGETVAPMDCDDRQRLPIAAEGCRWPPRAAYGRRGLPVVAEGCRWPPRAADGRQGLPMAAEGCRWPPRAADGRRGLPMAAAALPMAAGGRRCAAEGRRCAAEGCRCAAVGRCCAAEGRRCAAAGRRCAADGVCSDVAVSPESVQSADGDAAACAEVASLLGRRLGGAAATQLRPGLTLRQAQRARRRRQSERARSRPRGPGSGGERLGCQRLRGERGHLWIQRIRCWWGARFRPRGAGPGS
jgi:hypothetical protein